LKAQDLRLNGYAQYIFRDRIDSYYDPYSFYRGRIEDGFQWGVGLEYLSGATKGLELKYINRQAVAPIEYYDNGAKSKTFDLGINYIMVGANNYFKMGSKVEPYAGASLGAAIFNFKNVDASADHVITKFAYSVKLGTNIWVNEKIGIKLQADLLSAVQSLGGNFYFGTGGSGAGVSAYSSMYQWGLGGGLTFKIN
ncbi:MAG: hypothetical protein ACOYN4_15900, partial [Bacteroidales bacterium]